MKIFIDTANIQEIKDAATFGFIDGCTTNPSLIAKEGKDLVETIKEITTLIDGPISAEVQEGSVEDMYVEAVKYSKLHKNIVVKVPMTLDGLKLVKRLSAENIKTNVTLVFSVSQALAAAKAGATYVSPFMGRLDDMNHDGISGVELISKIANVFNIYGYDTQIIAASIRHTLHVEQAALAGSHVATIPYKVLLDMLVHPLTEKGLKIFREASKK